jgi:hypothetical protein
METRHTTTGPAQGLGSKQVPAFQEGQKVRCTLLDGHIKNRRGQVLGCAPNSAGEPVYLVEMLDPPSPEDDYGRHEGTSQVESGKKWVLSLYESEMTLD